MATTLTAPVEVTMEETTRTRLQRLLASKNVCVQVEGQIAAGKTSLLDRLAALGYKTCPEATEKWMHLNPFYVNQISNAFQLQNEVLLSYDAAVCPDARGGFVERGPSSALRVFVQQQREDGFLTDAQVELLHTIAREMSFVAPSIVLYLFADTETCHARIIKRNRGAETSVGRDYLARLDAKYREALAEGMTMPGEPRPHIIFVNTARHEGDVDGLVNHVEALVLEALTYLCGA
jgi:deoxyadenosine/deoxycytidine kinase